MRTLTEAGALDGDPLLSTVLLFVLFGFFAKFWTWSGQTLGMQVWCIRVQNVDGSSISLWQALLRFVVSIASWLCLGLGFYWSLFDKQKRSWHDMYSNTQLVQIPKKPSRPPDAKTPRPNRGVFFSGQRIRRYPPASFAQPE